MKKNKSNVLDVAWYIHGQLKGSGLTVASLRKVRKELTIVNRFFNTTDLCSVLLCAIANESVLDGSVDFRLLANHFKIEGQKIWAVTKAIEELSDLGLISRGDRKLDRSSQRLSPLPNVLQAMLKNDSAKIRPVKLDGLDSFFREFSSIQSLRKDGNIDCDQFIDRVNDLCSSSRKIPAIQYFLSFDLPPAELALLIGVSSAVFQGAEVTDIMNSIKEITDGYASYYLWCGLVRSQDLQILKEDLIEFTFFDIGIDSDVTLTQKAKEQLFANDSQVVKNAFKPTLCNYIDPQSISQVQLHFDDSLQSKLDGIRRALMPNSYGIIKGRMKERQLKGGLTILLHGLPGTGKTESVYQIARATNRVILRLEISKIKAMWVGESERNVKKVFTEYKRARKSYAQEPILLFNEADAIFSKRREVSNGVDQMENSLQNILLQELEEFEGILVATTNMTGNLDAAFERRFLFKLEFKMPSTDTRKKLLMSAFKDMNNEHLNEMARQFTFTGSAIQNVQRRLMLMELMNESFSPDIMLIKQFLSEEVSGFSGGQRIGFRMG